MTPRVESVIPSPTKGLFIRVADRGLLTIPAQKKEFDLQNDREIDRMLRLERPVCRK
jgi:hypothetical protein